MFPKYIPIKSFPISVILDDPGASWKAILSSDLVPEETVKDFQKFRGVGDTEWNTLSIGKFDSGNNCQFSPW